MATKGCRSAATPTPQETHQVLRMEEGGPGNLVHMVLFLASCEEWWAFLHESSTSLVIIGAVKTRLNSTLDYGEIAFGLVFEQLSTREFGGLYSQRRVGADHGRVVLHIGHQFCARKQTIDQAHTQGFVVIEAPAGKQDLTRIGWSD